MRARLFAVVILLLVGSLVAPVISAQDEVEEAPAEAGEEGEASGSAIYLPIKPAFVVNYGGPGKLRYIKAEVAVRVDSSAAANAIRHHLPYIRNNLVMLFASQTDASVDSQAGKEALRQDALMEIRKIVLEEDGLEAGVIDVFFNTLIVQR